MKEWTIKKKIRFCKQVRGWILNPRNHSKFNYPHICLIAQSYKYIKKPFINHFEIVFPELYKELKYRNEKLMKIEDEKGKLQRRFNKKLN